MVEFVKEYDLVDEVDLVECETSDVYMSERRWSLAVKSLEEFKDAGGNVENIRVYHGVEARKVSLL
jgi:hypothetical protein